MIARIQVFPLLLGLWVFGSLGVSHAAIYYVDFATGSDANNGTSTGTPWKRCKGDANATGTAAAVKLAAGDRVKFKGGVTYFGRITITNSGTSGNPITFDGNIAGDWGTGKAILDGEYVANTAIILGSAGVHDITIRNFTLQNGGGWADDHADVLDAAAGTKTNTLNTGGVGLEFYNAGGCTNIYLSDLYIHRMGGWRNGIGWTADTIQGFGIAIRNGTGVTVTNCEITKAAIGVGIYASTVSHNVKVVDCNIHNYVRWCVDVSPTANGCLLSSIAVHDNTIHDYGEFNQGNWLGVGEWPHTDGVFLRSGGYNSVWTNVSVFNNHFYSDGWGTATAGGTACIFIDFGPSVLIYNNLFNDDAHGRMIGISKFNSLAQQQIVRIYNNSFISSSPALIMSEETDANKRRVFIQNNIFRMPAGNPYNRPLAVRLDGLLPEVMDRNLYYDPNSAVGVKNIAQFPAWATLANFRAWYRMESNSLYADPLQLSGTALPPSSRNLALQSNSPAIGAGANLSAYFSTDKNGVARPATGGWDIGAFQFQAGSLSPAAASGLGGTAVSTTQVTLTWTDNANSETGFKIERQLTSGGSYVQIATVGANVVSYSDNGLTGGTAYSYRVRAINGAGDSAYSNEAGVTTPAVPATPAAAPSGLAATAVSSTQINLNWTDNANNETGFKLERSLASDSGFSQIQTVAANSTAFSDANLTAGTIYYYRIRATNGDGDSAYSSVASATTLSARRAGTVGVMLDASAATVTAPYELKNGVISQNSTSDDVTGGKATFLFDVVEAGEYYLVALVDAPTTARNSVFVNVDAEPLNPASIWHIPLTSGFQERVASWQGNGTWAQSEFAPKFFALTAGPHEVVLRNREPNTLIKAITIQKRAARAGDPVVVGP